MSPHRLGPYELREILGRGGMGTVYRGVETPAGKEVAVKVLSPGFASDASFRERFEAEIRTLEKLRHPNIVQLYGYGEQEGHLFYAMELVPGTSLQDELAAGRRFQWREVVDIGVEVCKALKHAHDHGVIHRDIKPANLLLAEDDHVKLSDFGIAKIFGNTQMTASGGMLGTADYMSPEQAEGLATTHKCDLYSLGAVLYALLTGRPPFQGKSLLEVIHKVRFDPPPPVRRLAADVPAELELLVEQLLAKEAIHRVPTARALSNRLQSIKQALSLPPPASSLTQTDSASKASTAPAADPSASRARMAGFETAPLELDSAGKPVTAPPRAAEGNHGGSGTAESPDVASFTTVEEARRRKLQREKIGEPFWLHAAKWVSLVMGILLVGGIIWQVCKPPTADQLFQRVQAAAHSGSGGQLLREEGAVAEFLSRFPADPRGKFVQEVRKDVELEKLQRVLERKARRKNPQSPLTPAEQIFLQAMRLEPLDLVRATEKLQDLINVFGADPDAPPHDRQIVELATRHLDRMQRRTAERGEHYLEVLQLRLESAKKLLARDPAQARRIASGIVRLYQDQPWAAAAVAEARKLLE